MKPPVVWSGVSPAGLESQYFWYNLSSMLWLLLVSLFILMIGSCEISIVVDGRDGFRVAAAAAAEFLGLSWHLKPSNLSLSSEFWRNKAAKCSKSILLDQRTLTSRGQNAEGLDFRSCLTKTSRDLGLSSRSMRLRCRHRLATNRLWFWTRNLEFLNLKSFLAE